MRKVLSLVVMLIFMFILVACGTNTDPKTGDEISKNEENDSAEAKVDSSEQSETIDIVHELDPNPVTVNKNPESIVVFDFGILDTLDELGIEVAGLPQTNIPSYLSKYEDTKYTNLGSLKEPDFEAIHSLQPDVIFISGRQADLYDELAKIAPTLFVGIDTADYMDSFKHNMNLIAELFDVQEEMDEQLTEIDKQIAEMNEKTSNSEDNALIILGTEGKISAYGPSSRFGIIHDVFGFKAADEDIVVATHGQSISFEYILEKNPSILFIIDRDAAIGGDASVKDSIENDIVMKTDAYKNNKLFYLNADYWYLSGGGLQSMKGMINEMSNVLE